MSEATLAVVDGQTNYARLLQETLELVRGEEASLLQWFWVLGGKVAEVAADNCWGDKTVERFADDLAAAGCRRSHTYLYQAMRFRAAFPSEAEVQKLSDRGWALRNAVFLCTDQVSPAFRRQLVDRVASGELSQADVREAVALETGSVEQAAREGTAATLRRAVSGTVEFEKQILRLSEAVGRLERMRRPQLAQYRREVQDTERRIVEVAAQLQSTLMRLKALNVEQVG